MKADGERLRMEREAMEGFVSPESHSNVKKQLMDMKVTKTQTNQTGNKCSGSTTGAGNCFLAGGEVRAAEQEERRAGALLSLKPFTI